MTLWFDAEKRPPKFNEEVLAYSGGFDPEFRGFHVAWLEEDGWYMEDGGVSCGFCDGEITHWMPLPEEPEIKEEPNP